MPISQAYKLQGIKDGVSYLTEGLVQKLLQEAMVLNSPLQSLARAHAANVHSRFCNR